MTTRLDHVNVQTLQLAATVAFYRDVIGLEQRDPPGLDPKLVQWMHGAGGHALVHISTVGRSSQIRRNGFSSRAASFVRVGQDNKGLRHRARLFRCGNRVSGSATMNGPLLLPIPMNHGMLEDLL